MNDSVWSAELYQQTGGPRRCLSFDCSASIEYNRGYNQSELNRILRLTRQNQVRLLEATATPERLEAETIGDAMLARTGGSARLC